MKKVTGMQTGRIACCFDLFKAHHIALVLTKKVDGNIYMKDCQAFQAMKKMTLISVWMMNSQWLWMHTSKDLMTE